MKYLPILLLCLPLLGYTQSETMEKQSVIDVIQQFFDGMRASDSTMIKETLHFSARLQTAVVNKEGKPEVRIGNIDQFLQSVGSFPAGKLDERIWSYDIRIDGPLATAWTEYGLFVDGAFRHCGVNAFHLVQAEVGWLITQITDTRRKENCILEQPDEKLTINTVLDQWHKAAATADEDVFFGTMTKDGIYLGTDASERWLRDELKEWSAKYFDRETAWAFTPHDRQIYMTDNGQIAWFEELLDTRFGTCRGSGVLERTPGGWKLAHYNLALTIPNERMDQVMETLKK